jgi:hypothetical protein
MNFSRQPPPDQDMPQKLIDEYEIKAGLKVNW